MDHDADEAIFARLRADLRATFPALRDVRFTHAWGGPVSATLDMFPAIGHLPDRDVVYALGCVGHGVSLCHLHGRTLTDLLLERETDLTESFFVDRRVPRFPPGAARRLVSEAVVRFMRWEDRRYDSLPD
jgi:glycine/D-amino acid oxidase-like deaminating enzyme